MKKLRNDCQKIYYNLDKILLLFFTSFTFMEFIWIPLNSALAEIILALTGQDYLSSSNIGAVLVRNPLVTLLFFLLFLANLLVAYLQIALLFTGIRQVLDPRFKHLPDYIRDVVADMRAVVKHLRISKVFFIFGYSAVLFPFLRRVLNIYYLQKMVIPQFLIDYASSNSWLVTIGILASIFLFYWLSARLIYALPQIYLEHQGVRSAVTYSWEKTRGGVQVRVMLRLLWMISQPALLLSLLGIVCYVSQIIMDKWVPGLAAGSALLLFILLKLVYYGAISLFMFKFVSLLIQQELPTYRRKRLRHRLRFLIILLSCISFTIEGISTFYFPFETMPLTISHRGVDAGNGVQNTLDSLEKTAQLQPDYIEMDVQETKDLQFVVMHDTDLQALTGNPGGTHDYSLAELTSMQVTENGMSQPIPSFEAYLDRADQLGQKLLVEIKVTAADSKDMVTRFLKLYGKRLLAKGHQMQSLDYEVITAIKTYDDSLVSLFILPFNSIYPQTQADGYTMEYSTLDQNFMIKSWLAGKAVYAWTPNDEDSMTQMINMQVDGIITDNMTDLQALIGQMKANRQYADLLQQELQVMLYRF